MKLIKSLIVGALVLASALTSYGLTASYTVAGNTSVPLLTNGGFVITQFVLTTTNNNTSVFRFYDAPTTNATFIIPAYIAPTNTVVSHTNVYTNWYNVPTTNVYTALVSGTNTFGPTTNAYPVRMIAGAGTNQTITIDSVNYYFNNGVMFTNIGAGIASVTITYQSN